MGFKTEKVREFIALILISASLSSCATIVGQSKPETLNINSAPDQANIAVVDEEGAKVFEGKTPTSVSLEKKRGYFRGKKYNVVISKEGYSEQSVVVDTKANGWYIGGNILIGGLIGWLIVDPASGAMWKLDTTDVNVTLEAAKQGTIIDPNKTAIVLLQDVPLSLRDKMVEIPR